MQEFARFYLAMAPQLAAEVRYVESPADVYTDDQSRIEAAIAGTGSPDGPAMTEATPAS